MADDMIAESAASPDSAGHVPRALSAEGRDPRLGVSSSMFGVSVGAAILAMGCGLAALLTGSEVYSIDANLAVATALAVGGGAVALAGSFAMATWGRSHIVELYVPIGVAALLVLVVLGVSASRIDDDRDLSRFFDSGGAVVLALSGGLFVVVSLAAAAAIPAKIESRSPRRAAVTAVLVVILGVGVAVPVAGAYANHPWNPQHFAGPTGGAYPTTLGSPSFHLLISEGAGIEVTDTGFVVADATAATAYDGTTGQKLWSIDLADLTPGRDVGPYITVDRARFGRVDTVVISRDDVGVQLESNTGRVIRHVSRATDTGLDGIDVHHLAQQRTATVDGRTVTVESAGGVVIDRFEVGERYTVDGEGPAGILLLRSDRSDRSDDSGTLMYRDVVAKRFGAFRMEELGVREALVGIASRKVIGVGENFVIADSSNLVVVNRSGEVVERSGKLCSGGEGIRGVAKLRGATLVVCATSDSRNGTQEIVGLR